MARPFKFALVNGPRTQLGATPSNPRKWTLFDARPLLHMAAVCSTSRVAGMVEHFLFDGEPAEGKKAPQPQTKAERYPASERCLSPAVFSPSTKAAQLRPRNYPRYKTPSTKHFPDFASV